MGTKRQEKKVKPCKNPVFTLSLTIWKFTGGKQNDINTNSGYTYS